VVRHVYIWKCFDSRMKKVESILSKKSYLLLVLLFVLIFNVFAYPVVAVGDVAYIFKNERIVDDNVIEVFEELGLEVDLINEKFIPSDLSNYNFIYLGDERYRNDEKIKIWKYRSIVSNYFYGDEWGLVDRDGVSKLAASQPLSVRVGGSAQRVYTSARFGGGGVNIPYFYLGNENKADGLIQVASTYNGNGGGLGDVISYGFPGVRLENGRIAEENICFFGIIESDYWTPAARDLFKECVAHVGISCNQDSDCQDREIGERYCVGLNVVQNVEEFQCVNPGTVQSSCVDDIVTNVIKTCTSGCQDGDCFCFDYDGDGYDDCNIGDDGDDHKEIDCNDQDDSVHPNAFEICDGKDNDCDGFIDEADGDCGIGSVCSLGTCVDVACDRESDCGLDGFFDGRFCDGTGNNDVYQNYIDFTCENPGTISSSCSQDVEARLVTQCSSTCSEGSCISINCFNDNDCDDNNDYTIDSCNSPGTVNSYCSHDFVECFNNNDCNDGDIGTTDTCVNPGSVNSYCSYDNIICFDKFDCGVDGFIDNQYCQEDDVFRNYREWDCINGGESDSYCLQEVSQRRIEQCNDACIDGSCAEVVCYNNADCDDGDQYTNDLCVNPGRSNSYCSHGEVACYNSNECGRDRYTGGYFCDGKDIKRNYVSFMCNLYGTDDSYCSSDVDEREVYTCNYACSEGSCIRCNVVSDCDDSYDNTVDVCHFGGSIDSYCSHEVVSCYDDFDCGDNGFVGTPYCEGDNVYQYYRDFECRNAGQSGSYCDGDMDSRLVDSCDYGCNGGRCVDETECEDGDDNDHDGYIDAQDPGCWIDNDDPDSYDPKLDDEGRDGIECNNDYDCGDDIYLDDPYCVGNNVYVDSYYQVCYYPGTGISYCDENVVNEYVEYCDYGCYDGYCNDVPIVFIENLENGDVVNDNNVYLEFDTDNWDIGGKGEEHIHFHIDNVPGLSFSDHLMFYNGNDRVVEFNFDPGSTMYATWIDKNTIRFNNVPNGNHQIRAHLATQSHSPPGNSEADVLIYIEVAACLDKDGDGYDDCNKGDDGDDGRKLDCNDHEFEVNAGAEEICDGIDNDCDGFVDEDDGSLCSGGSICLFGSCSSLECNDNKDNDNDDYIDAADPGCWVDPLDPMSYDPNLDDESRYDIDCNKNSDCGFDIVLYPLCSFTTFTKFWFFNYWFF